MSNSDDSVERTPESDVPEWPRPPEQPEPPQQPEPIIEYVALTDKKACFDLSRLNTRLQPGGDQWFGRGEQGDEMLCRVRSVEDGTVHWVLGYITLNEGEEFTTILTQAELELHPFYKNYYGKGPIERELNPREAAQWLRHNDFKLPADLDPAPPFDASEPPQGRLARDWQPGKEEPAPRTPGVVLRGRSERPLVNGVETDCLNDPQYDVIKALFDAGESGLSKKRLITKSKHTDAVNVLKRLAAEDPWRSVIKLAGQKCHGYRLAWTLPPDPTPNSTPSNTKQY
jgi:hypothetical protein